MKQPRRAPGADAGAGTDAEAADDNSANKFPSVQDGASGTGLSRHPADADRHTDRATVLHVPWQKPPSKRKREILLPASAPSATRPIRAETRASLVTAIAKAHRWRDELIASRVTDLGDIAARESCSLRKAEMTLSLAFLTPLLVTAAIEGLLPHGISVVRLASRLPFMGSVCTENLNSHSGMK